MMRIGLWLMKCVTGLFLGVAIAGVGCASSHGTDPATSKPYSELLTHPEKLRPTPNLPGAHGWVAPDANMKQYTSVLLDRIHVTLDEESEHESIDPVTLAGLVEFFRQDIVKALEPQYPVVKQAGPGVLTAQVTLVDLVPTNVTESVAVQAVPFGVGGVGEIIMGETQGTGFGSAPYLGHTGIVLQLRDSQSNRVIAEFTDTQFGKQYVVDMNKGVSESFKAGTTAYFEGFSKWSYAKQAFAQWSQFFRKRLDELRR